MPDFTLTHNTVFPAGTLVGAYERDSGIANNVPLGALVQEQVMGTGSLTFTDLDPGRYVAAAQVSGAWRSSIFDVPEPATLTNEMEEYVDSVVAGGILIDEATRDSDFTTTSTTGAEITGLSVVVPATEVRPVRITFTAALGNSTAAFTGGVRLVEDGVNVTDGVLCGVADKLAPIYGEIILPTPTAEHTYTVKGVNASAGTLTLKAGSGNVDMALRAWRA